MNGVNDNRPALSAKCDTGESPKRIVLIAFEGFQSIDMVGPSSVFARANELYPASYELIHASPSGGSLMAGSALVFAELTGVQTIKEPVDTVLIAGGDEHALRRVAADQEFMKWLVEISGKTRRVGSVCTGAFVLAAAGLLNGRKAVTHWASCQQLAELFPAINVLPDALYVLEDGVFTSAGVSASIDLALALVEADLGTKAASKIAKSMVLFLRRPGGQSQFSSIMSAQADIGAEFLELTSWIQNNLKAKLSVPELAEKVGMSERSFSRKFTKETDQTPAAYVRRVRLENARMWLETTNWPIKQVAEKAGFGSVDAFERALHIHFGTTASMLRLTFGHGQQT